MKNIKFTAIIGLNSRFQFTTGDYTDLIEGVHVAV